jgi:NADH:ubiquinone oxidoreductase subunit F (NADH-binding)
MIIQALRDIQDRRGYLPDEELEFLALRLNAPLARVHEVASFYPSFRRKPPCPVEVGVCRDLSCHLRGSARLLAEATRHYAGKDDGIRVAGVSCQGRCDHAPVVHVCRHEKQGSRWVTVVDQTRPVRDVQGLEALVDAVAAGGVLAQPCLEALEAQRRDERGRGPHWKIDVYNRAVDPAGPPLLPYESVLRFERKELTCEAIEAALRMSELEGMGGAAGRAGEKWRNVREQQEQPKYVVCNGDESEPGTFKDRELMLRVPHLIVEAMVLALRFLGAGKGYIFVRHEYGPAVEALRHAVRRANEFFLRENVFGPELPFQIEVVESPGGYICGEQTALLEALAGERAQPRLSNSSADIQVNGLHDKPTILNNVETLAWVPAIVLGAGGSWYAANGFGNSATDESGGPGSHDRYKGLRFFSISGDVNRPGVYEVPIGTPLRDLIERSEYAQGMRDGQALRAIASSGPSSGFLPADFAASHLRRRLEEGIRTAFDKEKPRLRRFLDALPESGRVSVLDLELATPLFRALNTTLGGGIVVYGRNSTPDMVGPALSASEFFRNESCGKCVPCRLGSQQLADLAARLAGGGYTRAEWVAEGAESMIQALERTLELTSICSLGRVAANPLATLITHFPVDIRAHLK